MNKNWMINLVKLIKIDKRGKKGIFPTQAILKVKVVPASSSAPSLDSSLDVDPPLPENHTEAWRENLIKNT